MFIEVLKSKIHRAVVTATNLHYEGSIALPEKLKSAVGFFPHEKVSIYNVNSGARFDTYVLADHAQPGKILVNGAAARLCQVGDVLIIVSYAMVDTAEAGTHQPKVIVLNAENQPT